MYYMIGLNIGRLMMIGVCGIRQTVIGQNTVALQQQFNLPLSEYLRYLFLLSQAVIDLHYCFELRL